MVQTELPRFWQAAAGLLLSLSLAASAQTEVPHSDPGLTLRLGLDSLRANPSKLGGGLTVGVLRPLEGGYYLGATLYSAALGEAGGLYLGGVEFGRAVPLGGPYFLDASIYLGGGGGAGQVPGDGLASRARLGLGRSLADGGVSGWDLMLGLARMNVRGSAIHANSMELVLQRRFDLGLRSADAARSVGEPPTALRLSALRPRLARYQLAGSAAFDALGIEAEFTVADSDWLPVVKTMGAARGNAQGYADWTVGARRYVPLGSSALAAYLDLGVGTGGGGAIASGSGLLAQVAGGLQWAGSKPWALQLEAGHLHSQGSFRAHYLAALLNWQDSGWGGAQSRAAPDLAPQAWALRGSVSQIRSNARLRQGPSAGRPNIETLDLQIERDIGAGAYLSGQTSFAMLGQAGGYQSGLLGAGWRQPVGAWVLNPELALGVAGGGGVATRGGGVARWQLNLAHPMGRQSQWLVGLGQMRAFKPGGMNSPIFTLGLTQHFMLR
ncbi:MAG: hypothetical protein WCK08_09865 [Betaproteobacteria bacterium]